ncbi:basic salivary proline-rich protein 1-like [Equus caballus]|uniref:basic salivary proline-rich protein 1-like n=1 Tax=Equus caballus TaxID=9796 RepID=UPI000C9E1F80|nr:uncharacterized protein LOC111775020 [Equus caballus]
MKINLEVLVGLFPGYGQTSINNMGGTPNRTWSRGGSATQSLGKRESRRDSEERSSRVGRALAGCSGSHKEGAGAGGGALVAHTFQGNQPRSKFSNHRGVAEHPGEVLISARVTRKGITFQPIDNFERTSGGCSSSTGGSGAPAQLRARPPPRRPRRRAPERPPTAPRGAPKGSALTSGLSRRRPSPDTTRRLQGGLRLATRPLAPTRTSETQSAGTGYSSRARAGASRGRRLAARRCPGLPIGPDSARAGLRRRRPGPAGCGWSCRPALRRAAGRPGRGRSAAPPPPSSSSRSAGSSRAPGLPRRLATQSPARPAAPPPARPRPPIGRRLQAPSAPPRDWARAPSVPPPRGAPGAAEQPPAQSRPRPALHAPELGETRLPGAPVPAPREPECRRPATQTAAGAVRAPAPVRRRMAAAGDRPDYRLAVPGKTAGGASPYCVPAREDLWTIEGVPLVCRAHCMGMQAVQLPKAGASKSPALT